MNEFNITQKRIDRSNLGLKTRFQRQQRSLNAKLMAEKRQADEETINVLVGKRTSSELQRQKNTLAKYKATSTSNSCSQYKSNTLKTVPFCAQQQKQGCPPSKTSLEEEK